MPTHEALHLTQKIDYRRKNACNTQPIIIVLKYKEFMFSLIEIVYLLFFEYVVGFSRN